MVQSPFFVGIDPGKTGGFALIDRKGKIVIASAFECWKHTRDSLVPHRRNIESCAIEKVASMSGQGVKSVFTFGGNYGGWLAFLELFHLSHILVPPQRWQRLLLGTFPKGASKSRSIEFIQRKYPHVTLRKKDHGISDAVCLALYALARHRYYSTKLRTEN